MIIPIVSLDKIYIKPDEENIFYFDCTRIEGEDRITSRKQESIQEQVQRISKSVEGNKIILADDVVFSGSVLRKIIDYFMKEGIEVVGILASISTKDGYDYFNQNLEKGLKTNILLGEDVLDQICERDFYFGIAGSGILVKTDSGLVKAPYFEPFGNPNVRASIPLPDVKSFSKGCIERSIALWNEIDRLQGKKTCIGDLPEKIIGTNEDEEVVKVLKKKGRSL